MQRIKYPSVVFMTTSKTLSPIAKIRSNIRSFRSKTLLIESRQVFSTMKNPQWVYDTLQFYEPVPTKGFMNSILKVIEMVNI